MHEALRYFIEKVVTFFSTEKYYQELLNAKNLYFEKTGKALEEDPDYESRMSSFNDWYVLQYKKNENDKTLIEKYIEENEVSEDLKKAVSSFEHSVYEFQGKGLMGTFVIKDLLHNKKIKLSKTHGAPSLVKGDLFLGRVASYGDEYYMFNGLCLIPRQAKRNLMKQIRKVNKYDDLQVEHNFLLKTEAMKTKWLRYGHVNVERIFVYPDVPLQ